MHWFVGNVFVKMHEIASPSSADFFSFAFLFFVSFCGQASKTGVEKINLIVRLSDRRFVCLTVDLSASTL